MQCIPLTLAQVIKDKITGKKISEFSLDQNQNFLSQLDLSLEFSIHNDCLNISKIYVQFSRKHYFEKNKNHLLTNRKE